MVRIRAWIEEFDAPDLLSGLGAATLVAACCFIDWRLFPRMGRMLSAGYDAVYLLLPLCFIAAAGGVRYRRAAWAVLVVVALLVAGPMAHAKFMGLPKNWATEDPANFLRPLGAAAVLSVGSLAATGARADDWGIGFGDWRWWGPKLGIAVGVIVPFSFLAVAVVPGLQDY